MNGRLEGRRALFGLLAGIAAGLAMPAVGVAAVQFTRMGTIPGTGGPVYGFVRTPNGTLHIVFPTSDNGAQGLTARTISPAGAIGPSVTALPTNWSVSLPGLVAMPGGTLEAIFGAISPTNVSSLWGITSADGGTTWSAPVDVRSGPALEALAYNSAITAKLVNGATPVLTVPQAGNLVIQTGLGPNSPDYLATNSTDGEATDPETAVDAATGAVVSSWDSLEHPGGLYLQKVAPAAGMAQQAPGRRRDFEVIAGRDKGPGVYGAYTTDDKHVRLMRYGGGTEGVGSLASVTPAALGVATGPDGRIWVMWGSDNGNLAVTRSNRTVTKWEPIQHLTDRLITLNHLSGDGRLGPLDLLVDEIADTNPTLPTGVFHARVLPQLSASFAATAIKNTQKQVAAHKLTVTVTDAGDAVSGATVTVKGHKQKTNVHGAAKITVPGSGTGPVKVTVTAPSYQALTEKVKL